MLPQLSEVLCPCFPDAGTLLGGESAFVLVTRCRRVEWELVNALLAGSSLAPCALPKAVAVSEEDADSDFPFSSGQSRGWGVLEGQGLAAGLEPVALTAESWSPL